MFQRFPYTNIIILRILHISITPQESMKLSNIPLKHIPFSKADENLRKSDSNFPKKNLEKGRHVTIYHKSRESGIDLKTPSLTSHVYLFSHKISCEYWKR